MPCAAYGVGSTETWDNRGEVNTVEQPRQREDVAERVAKLTLAEPDRDSTRTMPTIRKYARELLDGGYPREELYADFERAVEVVRQRSSDAEAEDPILDVMDLLVGWCSPGVKL